jgi:hypothetical protein
MGRDGPAARDRERAEIDHMGCEPADEKVLFGPESPAVAGMYDHSGSNGVIEFETVTHHGLELGTVAARGLVDSIKYYLSALRDPLRFR